MHKIYDWFELHTIETITASLDKMIERLHALAEKLRSEVLAHRAEATKLVNEAQAKAKELADAAMQKEADAQKALATAGKITDLLR